MTDEDDTRQPARLPLIERARLGLSIEETELTPEQIAALEFSKDGVGQSWWCGQIEQAIKAGELAAHVEKTVTVIRNGVRLTKKYRDGELSDSKTEAVSPSSREQDATREKYFIPRDAYADWRAGAAVFRKPAEFYIDLWLPILAAQPPSSEIERIINFSLPSEDPRISKMMKVLESTNDFNRKMMGLTKNLPLPLLMQLEPPRTNEQWAKELEKSINKEVDRRRVYENSVIQLAQQLRQIKANTSIIPATPEPEKLTLSALVPDKSAPAPERAVLREMVDYLPLREQALLGYLPDALHVEQIATLEYPDNQTLALAYANVLLNTCSNNGLSSTEAQYQDWWIEDGATGEVSEEFQWWYKKLCLVEKGSTPLVTRTAYRDWLVQQGRPLPAWWFPEPIKPVSTEEIRFRVEKKLSIKNPCSVPYWITVEWWTLEQASFIFIGHEPIDDDDRPPGAPFPWKNAHPASKRLYESLRAAVEIGTIFAIPIIRNGREGHRVKSLDAYQWLRDVYKETVHVPTELVEFFEAALLKKLKQVEPPLALPALNIGTEGRQTTKPSTSGSRHPAEMRQCVTDKAQFLENATWQGTQQATVNNHPEASRFKARYDTPTLLRWVSEIDPRPKDKRGGRPHKK